MGRKLGTLGKGFCKGKEGEIRLEGWMGKRWAKLMILILILKELSRPWRILRRRRTWSD